MKIKAVNIYKYSLPFKRTFTSSNRRLHFRSGLILQLIGESGVTGLGEIAPFPGLSVESLEDALKQILQLKDRLNKIPLPGENIPLTGFSNTFFQGIRLFPGVEFGIESAFLNLIANSNKCSLPELLFKKPSEKVAVNALLTYDQSDLRKEILNLKKLGFRTFKIKVGLNKISEEVERISRVKSLLSGQDFLRLDANGAWSLPQAVKFGRLIEGRDISFVEEPVKFPTDISEFFRKTRIPVALDESFSGEIGALSDLPQGVVALILKPGISCGLEDAIRIAGRAKEIGITPVFSCPFYSGIGWRMVAQLSTGFCDENVAMGLDTLKWFREDLLEDSICVRRGQILTKKLSDPPQFLRMDFLEKIGS